MPRLLPLGLVLLAALPAFAQKDPEPKDGKVTIAMTLSPVAPPKPLSKGYLFPEYGDLQPGNRILGLLKSFMEQDNFFKGEEDIKRHQWQELPLDQFPDDVRAKSGVGNGMAYESKYSTFLARVDLAARYTHVDWDEWFGLRKDGIYYLLPEVQRMRSVAAAIRLRMRAEVKAREFDRALVSAKTLFGIAQALERHPTLIGNLVSIAIASMAVATLEEMVQQPGCPNLYWSFTDLPSPPVAVRHGAAGERVFLLVQFGTIMKADRALSEGEVADQLRMIDEMAGMEGGGGNSGDAIINFLRKPRIRYQLFAADPKRVADGRAEIVARGAKSDVVAKFTPLQVVLTIDLYRFEEFRDDYFKWMNQPYPIALPGLQQAERDIKKEKASGESILGPLFLPAVMKVKQAEARIEQRFALLRTIEAIRLHAHGNGGKLPATLAEIQVPLPTDPVNGKPFEYGVKDDVATLHGQNPQKGSEVTNRHYEIRLRK